MTRGQPTIAQWHRNTDVPDSLAEELAEAQRYIDELAQLMVKRSMGCPILLYRCHGCGKVRENRGGSWRKRYCCSPCKQRAYRWRQQERSA